MHTAAFKSKKVNVRNKNGPVTGAQSKHLQCEQVNVRNKNGPVTGAQSKHLQCEHFDDVTSSGI